MGLSRRRCVQSQAAGESSDMQPSIPSDTKAERIFPCQRPHHDGRQTTPPSFAPRWRRSLLVLGAGAALFACSASRSDVGRATPGPNAGADAGETDEDAGVGALGDATPLAAPGTWSSVPVAPGYVVPVLSASANGVWVTLSNFLASASPKTTDTITIKVGRLEPSGAYVNVDSWTDQRITFTLALPATLAPLSPTTAVVGGEGLFAIVGGGARQDISGPSSGVRSLFAVSPSDIWAGNRTAQLLHYTALDGSMVRHNLSDLDSVEGLWIGRGMLYLATDAGLRVVTLPLADRAEGIPSKQLVPGSFYAIAAAATDDAFASGADGAILHFDGSSWTHQASGVKGDMRGLAVAARDDAWASNGDVLLHYDGVRWSRVSAPVTGIIDGLAALPDGELWMTIDGLLHHRSPGPVGEE